MTEQVGLREQKKIDTRRRLQGVALDLFAARGFDRVTVTEIARDAHVSPATVFNYFPTKEDLVLHGMTEYGERLIGTLRDRAPGVSVLEAFRAHLLEPRGVRPTTTRPRWRVWSACARSSPRAPPCGPASSSWPRPPRRTSRCSSPKR
ncbi:TetR/AcrR family transcriptional regulator [Tsukamurella sp. PLM1]|uniref:TetR/AcrR family transcriptional regulator n=1 Tax=Tsukamurella sp. PLM1 TaxID=2929795 RepID=UPI002045CC86|nr:TetR family transcriptional regulator [Tsukamurella sp. PLM1]BDH55239.1 hypothetical protein MTP03_01780 [Tsukamurella sp. PLM1]